MMQHLRLHHDTMCCSGSSTSSSPWCWPQAVPDDEPFFDFDNLRFSWPFARTGFRIRLGMAGTPTPSATPAATATSAIAQPHKHEELNSPQDDVLLLRGLPLQAGEKQAGVPTHVRGLVGSCRVETSWNHAACEFLIQFLKHA